MDVSYQVQSRGFGSGCFLDALGIGCTDDFHRIVLAASHGQNAMCLTAEHLEASLIHSGSFEYRV